MHPLWPIMRAARRLLPVLQPLAPACYRPLQEAVSSTRVILRKLGLISPIAAGQDIMSLGGLYEYLDILLLLEVRAFHSLLGLLKTYREQLQLIYLTVGELDALQSAASYRASVGAYAEPSLEPSDRPLEIVDAAHPLLEHAVTNSITIHRRGVLITGSNMSGKTTFARTVAVNAILAQTICTCVASAYRGPFFQIISSISEVDSLVRGESYYLVQAKRLLAMVRISEQKVPILCIIDELLNGTNSTERLAASYAILEYLAGRNAWLIVSTHDLELAGKLSTSFRCYHFSDEIDEAGLKFDFKLKEGISTTRNAINLLAQLGYPEQVISTARQAVHDGADPAGRSSTRV